MKKSDMIKQLQAEIEATGDCEFNQPITEAEELRLGKVLVKLLNVKKDRQHPDRFITAVGSYTALGLFRLTSRVIVDGEDLDI